MLFNLYYQTSTRSFNDNLYSLYNIKPYLT